MIDTLQATGVGFKNKVLNASLASISRLLQALNIAYPRIADMRKYPHRGPQDALALANLLEERCRQLLEAVALLRHVAQAMIEAAKGGA
jgi:hypothetical protein